MLRHYPLRRLAYIVSHSDSNFLMNLRTAHSMTLRPFALAAGAVALGDTTNNHAAKETTTKNNLFFERELQLQNTN